MLNVERVPLDAFLPFVMVGARGVPEALALGYIRQACIDFATRSGILRRVALLDEQRYVRDYPLWPDAEEQIVRVNEVALNGIRYRGGRDRAGFRSPWFWRNAGFTIRDGVLLLAVVPQCDRPEAIDVRMCVAPTQRACEVDALLLDDWQQAIEDGALARLYQLPGYSFSAPMLATARGRSFDEAIARARIRALKSDTGESMRAVAPPIV